jgi:putative flippase GtrA
LHIDSIIGRQFLRYAAVGLVSNLLLYVAYLLITRRGVGYKTTMTLLYAAGVSLTFVFNKNWTFSHQGHVTKAFITYLLIYALGYIINLVALYVLVDKLGFRHQLIQGFVIGMLAVLLFTLQKYLVFRKT